MAAHDPPSVSPASAPRPRRGRPGVQTRSTAASTSRGLRRRGAFRASAALSGVGHDRGVARAEHQNAADRVGVGHDLHARLELAHAAAPGQRVFDEPLDGALSARAPYAGSFPSRTISERAAGVKLQPISWARQPPRQVGHEQIDEAPDPRR